MLGMPRGTTLEKLTFGDIVKVSDAIIGNEYKPCDIHLLMLVKIYKHIIHIQWNCHYNIKDILGAIFVLGVLFSEVEYIYTESVGKTS